MHGYSSSEESEDPRRPKPQPAASSNNQDQKKKKKKKLPPQQSINRIWKKFSNRSFHKALAVLPFDPVLPPASSERPNELIWASYERAADECRRKVQKIIKECKRVNMRYRDPGWDLDWDLKYEKGHCLNSLGSQKFELTASTLLGTSATVPKAVKRVHEIFEEPTFMQDITGADIKQGSLGDCWIMAGLTALTNVEDGVKRLCVAYDSKVGIYGFVFFRDGEWIYSIIDDKLYLTSPCWDSPSMQRNLLQQIDREDVERVYKKTYQTGSKALFFASCANQRETWVPLMEKAYAKAHGDYASLSGGSTGEGLEDLSGGVTTEMFSSDILDTDHFWEKELSKVNDEFLFGCSTGLMERGHGYRNGICEGHAYIIMEARTLKSGQRLVKLRNPWGNIRKGLWDGAWSDGSKEWTPDVQQELGHKFGSDSVFWISYEDLLRKYTQFDRTRLFRNSAWRSCQRWIGVDVPWKPEYHEKFHIKLTRDSPLVIVLSQLDKRYFKGLAGQYRFQLYFRVHEQDRPDAEDYIVRSYGNYLTNRAVSVELPDMPAGNYAIYLKVVGQRDNSLKSVEEVVKRECEKRGENEKLAQVGHAYDLAHSKAWDHMDKVAKMRNKQKQKKASSYRQKARHRQWEKRHLNRDAGKKQTQKNKDKKQRRRDAWEEEHPPIEEKEEEEKKQVQVEKTTPANEEPSQDEPTSTLEAVLPRSEDKEDVKEANSKSNDGTNASDSTGSPQDTPKTEDSSTVQSEESKQEVPPLSGPPPPAPSPAKKKAVPVKAQPKYDSDGDSSDSPVEDWEQIYSSDDMTRKPRTQPVPPLVRDDYDSEEEKLPDPWNAICIVGIRVYSQDPDLELRTVLEGGELLEGGMGERGQVDLDDAQANAGGSRADKDGDVLPADLSPYPPVVRRDGGELEGDQSPEDKNSFIKDYLHIESADTTQRNSPAPTPMENDDKMLERPKLR